MTKNINLTIISKRYEADTEAMAQPPADVRPQELKIVTEAVLESTPGRVEIIYDESELSGLQGNSTHLIFNPDDPDIFTMQRTGPASTTMVFIPGMRHVCKYHTPLLPFELILTTHSLSNRLFDEGWLEVDYTTELGRTSHARTMLRLDISPVGEGEQ